MKRSVIWLAAMVILLMAAGAMAQGGKGRDQRGGTNGNPGSACLSCAGLNMDAVKKVTGTVVELEGGPGKGIPTLTLQDGGDELEIVVGPYRLWVASGLEVTPGEELTVIYATCTNDGHLVALEVTEEETGTTVQLRDLVSGMPVGFGRCGCCCS